MPPCLVGSFWKLEGSQVEASSRPAWSVLPPREVHWMCLCVLTSAYFSEASRLVLSFLRQTGSQWREGIKEGCTRMGLVSSPMTFLSPLCDGHSLSSGK